MALDENWIETQKLWIAGQDNLVQQLQQAISYSYKEIELHKESIAINGKMLLHYLKGIDNASKVMADYISENK